MHADLMPPTALETYTAVQPIQHVLHCQRDLWRRVGMQIQLVLYCTCSISLKSAQTESNKADYGKDRERILIAVSVDLHGGATAVTIVTACLGM